MNSNIDTVIFDLDGTLLNTLNDLYVCFNYALKTCGYKERTLEEVRIFVGNGIKKAFERALGTDVDIEAAEELIEIFKGYYIRHLNELTEPYSGIMELLKKLKEKNYKMAIVSNKYDEAVKELNNNFFSEYIKVAIGEGGEISKKPASDGIIRALGQLGKGLENVIYVGDSEVDVKTAQNANIPCISVLWGFKDKEFLEKHGGKVFAETPDDIINIIEKKLYLV